MKKLLVTSVFTLAGLNLLPAATLLAQAPAQAPASPAPASPAAATGQAPAAGASADQITIKDPAEYNAYNNAVTQTDPKAKASASESFLTQYPQSIVKKAVLDGMIDAYATYDQAKTVDAAQRMLQLDPNNLKAIYLIVFIKKQQSVQVAQSNPTQQAQLLDDGAALATKGLAVTKPEGVKDEDFKKQKSTTDPFFHSVLAYDAIYSKKDMKTAISEFRTELEMTAPDATKVAPALNDTLILGQTYSQLTPPDMVNAVWFLSRAENFAPDNFKPVIDKQARYWYKRYHGKEDGFDDIKAKSAASVFPPTDLAIAPAPTPADTANKVVADTPDLSTLALADKEYILANASKENADKVWDTIKDKTSEIPGTVIAATASQLQVAVTEDAKADKKADFTVNMKAPLADKDVPAVGTDVKGLVGTFDSYTQSPAQIILRDGEIQSEAPKKRAVPARKPAAGHKPAAK